LHLAGRAFQHLQEGIVQADAKTIFFHQATGSNRGARGIQALLLMQPARGGETLPRHELADAQPAAGVLQLQFQDRQVGIFGASEGMHPPHRGNHRGGFPWNQGLDPHEARIVDVIARVVADQILQTKQTQLRQPTGELGANALEL